MGNVVDLDTIIKNREMILDKAEEHKIRTIKVFGSVVRGEEKLGSDLDFIVEFKDDADLFDLIQFKQALEDFFGVRVDVVTENSIHRLIKEEVLKEAIPV